jgi:hypothetical protein
MAFDVAEPFEFLIASLRPSDIASVILRLHLLRPSQGHSHESSSKLAGGATHRLRAHAHRLLAHPRAAGPRRIPRARPALCSSGVAGPAPQHTGRPGHSGATRRAALRCVARRRQDDDASSTRRRPAAHSVAAGRVVRVIRRSSRCGGSGRRGSSLLLGRVTRREWIGLGRTPSRA